MKPLQTLVLIIAVGLISCEYSGNESATNTQGVRADSTIMDTTQKPAQTAAAFVDTFKSADPTLKSKPFVAAPIPDTIKRVVVDDYPVTNAMLRDKIASRSAYEKKSGQIYSYDKIWFSNDTLKQILVFELYTDCFRFEIFHFLSNDIPKDLINKMELNVDGGNLALEKQKQKDFGGFLKQTKKINSTYFITNKGFSLGDPKQKVIDSYGIPSKEAVSKGIEKLEWEYFGDQLYDGKTDLKGKPLAKNSFGHRVIMYFRNGKLIGHILYNEIP